MPKKKLKPRSFEEKDKLIKRLNIIEGQIKGVKDMIDKDRYCGDVVMQISAIDKSLKSVGNIILKEHAKSCIEDRIKEGDDKAMDELLTLFERQNR